MKIRGFIITQEKDAKLSPYYDEAKKLIEGLIQKNYKTNCNIYSGWNEVKIIDVDNCEITIDIPTMRNIALAYYGMKKTKRKKVCREAFNKLYQMIVDNMLFVYKENGYY